MDTHGAGAPVVIGVDIGTTATKVVAYDPRGRRRFEAEDGYPLDEPEPGQATQDPARILAAVRRGLVAVAGEARSAGVAVAGVAFSSALHSLMALDGGGEPITPLVTWADGRATEQAERIRTGPLGAALHQRTGTPVHPMAPLAKLVWFRERQPALFARAALWLGIKEFVVARLTGRLAVDRSIASATGLADLQTGTWWPPALAAAGVEAARLPPVVPTTEVIPAPATPLPGLAGVPFVIGAGDGPLANLGLGAVAPGVAACSIGTSGALRLIVERPGIDPAGRVFCYALTEERWAVGGAVSNGGAVLDWAARTLCAGPVGTPATPEQALAVAAEAPPGSDGLVMLPYLLPERAPQVSPLARGAYAGLRRAHGPPHLVRAALEGVCQQLATVLEALEGSGHRVVEVRATGGFLRPPFTRQLLADVFGRPVGFAGAAEGSAFGAALLGMHALGLIGSLELAAGLVPITETRLPEPTASGIYEQQRRAFEALQRALGTPPAPGQLSPP
jgi:gluconokinase